MSSPRAALACAVLAACGGSSDPAGGDDDQADQTDAGDQPGAPDGGSAATDDYAEPGPATTGSTDVVIDLPGDRAVDGTVCAPDGATDRPLAIIAPGFQMGREQYASYCEHLASWGYPAVVVTYDGFLPDHSDAADDLRATLDWAAGAPELAGWDGDRVLLAGHSLGGKLSILAAVRDPRIGVVVAWDPVDASSPSVTPELMGDLGAPLVLLGETLDGAAAGFGGQACAPSANNYAQYFDGADGTAIELTVIDADHMDWVDDGSCFACGFCQDGAADREAVRALTRRTTVAALRRYLEDDAAAATWLDGAGVAADVAAGRVTLRTR